MFSRSTTLQKSPSPCVLFSRLDSAWHLPNILECYSKNHTVLGPHGGQRYATLHALISVLERGPIPSETNPRSCHLINCKIAPLYQRLFYELSLFNRSQKVETYRWSLDRYFVRALLRSFPFSAPSRTVAINSQGRRKQHAKHDL